MRFIALAFCAALLASLHAAAPVDRTDADIKAAEKRLRADLRFLTSPDCEGRAVGTKGIDLAAEYIARQFDRAGLRPGGDGKTWFQSFDLAVSAQRGRQQALELRGQLGQTITLEHGEHFFVPFASPAGVVTDAPLVFAGYGLNNARLGYNDLGNLDVKGKVAVVIEGAPRGGKDFPARISLADRAREAKRLGAIALLVVNRRGGSDRLRDRMGFTYGSGQPAGLPVLRIARADLDSMLVSATGRGLVEVEKEIDAAYAPRSTPLPGWTCRLKTDVTHKTVRVKNVVAVLDGKGPLANETVVIGADYDHVGLAGVPGADVFRPSSRFTGRRSLPGSIGGAGFPALQMFAPAIHPGADDNASGTVAVMELARRFAARKNPEGRRMVFITFTAEEGGLHGSAYYCRRAVYPIKTTAAMLNMDMVGRMQDGKLRVSGLGTAKAFRLLVDRHEKGQRLSLMKKDTIDGATDHLSFFEAGVPVLSFFTGFHEQYHRPTDRFETVNIPGIREVVSLVGDLAEDLTITKERPKFIPNRGIFERTKTLWASAPCTGILPSFRDGVVVDGVVPQTPADRAGLRKGDRIVGVGQLPILSAAEFLAVSRKWRSGQRVVLHVRRGDEKVQIALQLDRLITGLEETPALLLGFSPDFGDPENIRIDQVRKGGPADTSGVKVKDRIVAINGREIMTIDGFLAAIEGIRSGSSYQLTLSRDGKTFDVKLTARAAPQVGFSVESREGVEGLFLVDVRKGGPAARAGLAEGDKLVSIDGKEIKTATAFAEAVLAIRDSAKIVVSVDGTRITRMLRLGPSKDKPLDAKAVDAIVSQAMQKFEVPGVAVGIVRDGEVIYLAGHGLRDREGKKPVTPDTQFAIASVSKAFTAAGIGVLVEEGKMKWDDPVRKHLPNFRLRDELADREVTIRDLLSHRTGVIRHDILWLVNDWNRDEMIRRACLLKQDKSFRSEWGYNNFQYLMAGEASARAAGTTWETLLRSRLLDPLGMKNTTFSIKDLVKSPDFARTHGRKNDDGPVEAVPPRNIDNIGPAGSINSSVREMTAWLRMQLDEGAFEGKRLLKPATVRAMHAPVGVVPMTESTRELYDGVTVQMTYALGWGIRDYRGQRMVTHAGAIDGYRSIVALLPQQRIGIVVLSNLGRTSVPEAVANSIADLLLGAEKRDWVGLMHTEVQSALGAQKKREADLVKARKKGTRPSLSQSGYTGKFEEGAHGTITIREVKGKLMAQWGRYDLPLEHWHHDTWRLGSPGDSTTAAWGDRLLNFRLNKAGEVEAFEYLGHEFRKTK